MRRGLDDFTPLCGTGVASMMELMFMPVPATPRMALSRAGPTPLTTMRTLMRPNRLDFSMTSFATRLAAYGVDFLEPLNPSKPALENAMTLPARSLMAMSVLLYE